MQHSIFGACSWAVAATIALLSVAAIAGGSPRDEGLVAFWSFDGTVNERAGAVEDNLTGRDGIARFVTADQLPATSGGVIALGVDSTDVQYLTAPMSADVKLSNSEHTLVRLWIDTAAQYAGTYAAYGTGQIGAWWRNNEPIREMADNWPTTLPATESIERRCAACHGRMLPRFVTDQVPVDAFGDLEGWQRPTSRFSRHTVFDLTQPEKSLILMAPLSRQGGGYAVWSPEAAKLITEDRSKPPKPASHPVIFASADDPDYRKILAHLRAAQARLDEIKRFDMPGFKPRAEYVREMKRYGVLAASFDPASDAIDVYAADQAYFRMFWHRPTSNRITE